VTISAVIEGGIVKIGQTQQQTSLSTTPHAEASFADQIKQKRRMPVGSRALPPAVKAPQGEIVQALVDKLGQSDLPPEGLQAKLQASLGILFHSPNLVFGLHAPGQPDRLAKGLSTKETRELQSIYLFKNGYHGSHFNDAFEKALLTKINSPPSAKGAAIVKNFEKLRDDTREEARKAFPNDRKKAATMASELMRDRLFLLNNPGIKLPPGVPLGHCSVIIRRFTDKNGVNERVAGLMPTDKVGDGPNPIPFQHDIPPGKRDAFYIYASS
jgi:hypothetical protein